MGASAVVHDAVGEVEDGSVTVDDQESAECATHPTKASALTSAKEFLLRRKPLACQRGERFAEPADGVGHSGAEQSSILLRQRGGLGALLVDTVATSTVGAVFVRGGSDDRAEVA